MARKWSGILTAAVCFLVVACGRDGSQVTPDTSRLNDSDTTVAESPTTGGAQSCDLLGDALASSDGWIAVKRGNEDFMAKHVEVSEDLAGRLNAFDSRFDASNICVQVLKSGSGDAFVEIVPESCGRDDVIHEDREGAIRLTIGSLKISESLDAEHLNHHEDVEKGKQEAPKQEQVQEQAPKQEAPKQEAPKQEQVQEQAPKQEAPKQEAPKQEQEAPKQEAPKQEGEMKGKGPSCLSSLHGLLFTEKKGQREVGQLRIDLILGEAPVEIQEQGKGGKGKEVQQGAPVVEGYNFTLVSLEMMQEAPTGKGEEQVQEQAPKQEAPKQEQVQEQAPKQEAPKQEQVQEQAPKQEAPKQEAPKQEQVQEQAPKQEAPKQEAPKQEAPKQEQVQEQAPKQEAPKQEAPKQEAPKQEAPKQEQIQQK